MQASAYYAEQTIRDRGWPSWVGQWSNRKCLQAAAKFQDTFWKLIRAGNYLSDAISTVRELKDSRNSEDAGRFASALDDIPLYLDMLWIYLRLQADVFSTLVSYLYEGQGTIPDESFRSQRRWFTKVKPAFDARYSDLLRGNSGWFDDLAGQDPKGIRDIVIHQRGTYQLGWIEPVEGEEIGIEASLVRDARIVSHDVIPTLVSVIDGYCQFLDEWVALTIDRMKPVFGHSLELPNIVKKPYFSFGGRAMACAWMFPRIERIDNAAA